MNFWLSPSVKQHRNPCSGPPPVYQDLSTRQDWPFKKAIVHFPIRLKGNLKRISINSVESVGVEHGMQPRHRCVLTINIAKSGTCPVMPKMVVFKYLSCPAKSMNVITWKQKIFLLICLVYKDVFSSRLGKGGYIARFGSFWIIYDTYL